MVHLSVLKMSKVGHEQLNLVCVAGVGLLRSFQWGSYPQLMKPEYLLVAIGMHLAVGAGLSIHSSHKFEGKLSCPPHPTVTTFLVVTSQSFCRVYVKTVRCMTLPTSSVHMS